MEEMGYLGANAYLKKRFGGKVYRLSLDGGMTCPNRDGTKGHGGCIFCNGGSGTFSEGLKESVTLQLEEAKKRIRRKTNADQYIAYFQSFTNTYAPVDYLRALFTEAIENPEVVVLSIATRPDCLPDEVIALLRELNERKPVWIELGLQTIHEKTADYIRRGYPLSVYEDAVRRLKGAGIEIITHVILGLPGESKEDMLATCRYLAHSPYRPDGIKLQLLHVLKDTDLYKDYEKGAFSVLSLEEYLDILTACVMELPPDMVIHRMTGDGPRALLADPLWSLDKKRVLNTINAAFRTGDIYQGKHFIASS